NSIRGCGQIHRTPPNHYLCHHRNDSFTFSQRPTTSNRFNPPNREAEMSERYNNASGFVEAIPDDIIEAGYQDQLRKIQEDMSEGLKEAVAGGWMTQEEADQMEYEWIQTFRPCELPKTPES